MGELVETRWRRYGRDRVYVKTSEGVDVGHLDLVTGEVVTRTPGYERALADCSQRWLTPTPPGGTAQPPALLADPSRDATPVAATRPGKDYAANVAGAAARAKRDEVNAQAPMRNFVARLLGVKTSERAWRVGAKGEQKVAAELARLPDDWRVLHAVEVGERGSDIDHVVIGPAGVFTLNAKRHPGGNAWVSERLIMVNGQRTPYVRSSQHEARRAHLLLTNACGFDVSVRGVVVFVDLDRFTVKQAPADIDVTTRRRLVRWLRSLPTTTDKHTVETIYDNARQSTTWT